MRKFLQKALQKLSKLDKEQIESLISDLASENEMLEGVLDSMTTAILVLDRDHSIVFLNNASRRILEYNTPDPREKVVWSVLEDDEMAGFLKETLLGKVQVMDREFAFDNRGGGARILSCSLLPLKRRNVSEGTLLYLRDITERKQREARLRRAESLASLTTLTAGVAHEIKNPLGSIGIRLQLIQKALQKKKVLDKESVGHHLEVLNEEVERLNGIVVDFLFAVRPMDTTLVDEDLNALLNEAADFISYEMRENSISIETDLDGKIPLLQLDAKYLKQALLNIFKNAQNAMPEGGRLEISTGIEGGDVALTIRDSGIGIAEENLGKIFEPYFTTKEFGSGLGLTLVYKIIKEHRGEISVDSKEGRGTTFSIRFPIPDKARRLIGWSGEDDAV